MRTMLTAALVAAGAGAADCGSSQMTPAVGPCTKVVLEDTTVVYVDSQGRIVAAAKGDTVPKPYKTCLTVYAAAKDTVPKP